MKRFVMGRFSVDPSLCLKDRLNENIFMQKNSFSQERFCTSRFKERVSGTRRWSTLTRIVRTNDKGKNLV